MLSKVLSRKTCAECKFCCSFRRCSLWETPLFPQETVEKLRKEKFKGRDIHFVEKESDGFKYGQMDLTSKYVTEAESEETPCEFLDSETGCVLHSDDKPFDCKIWPLRIMNKDGELVIALTPTCPAINVCSKDELKQLINGGLGQKIYEYAKEHPYIIKEYKEGFPVLMRFGSL